MNINAEKYGAYTEKDWYDNDVMRMGEKGAKMFRRGAPRAKKLGLWKLARKELYQYIGKDLDFVK